MISIVLFSSRIILFSLRFVSSLARLPAFRRVLFHLRLLLIYLPFSLPFVLLQRASFPGAPEPRNLPGDA